MTLCHSMNGGRVVGNSEVVETLNPTYCLNILHSEIVGY